MPSRRTLCAWCLCASMIACRAALLHADRSPHLRPLAPHIAWLLQRGSATSPTFAAIVKDIERSDVIVHIEGEWMYGGTTLAHTRFITAAGGRRYLRITLSNSLTGDAAVGLLGHELCHVREIAQTPWVTSEAALGLLYERIGRQSSGSTWSTRGYETRQAHDTEWQVRREMRSPRLSTD